MGIESNELLIVSFADEICDDLKNNSLQLLGTLTTKLFLKGTKQELGSPDEFHKYKKLGICGLVIKINLSDIQRDSISADQIRNVDHQSRVHLEPYFEFNNLSDKSGLQFNYELILSPENIEALFPTLIQLFDFNINWIFLDSRKLSINRDAPKVKEQFELLKIYSFNKKNIYFSIYDPYHKFWEHKTGNLFRGPEWVDIDVANTCTHNCLFCVSYSEKSIEKRKSDNNGVEPEVVKKMLRAKIDYKKCIHLIETLPEKTRLVTFGGMGEPFTHPNILEFILSARKRGFFTTIFTHFAHVTEDHIRALHEHCSSYHSRISNVHFVVNLAAATEETYVKIRPNQTKKTFRRIIKNLRYASEIRREEGSGISFVLMSVTNRYNYKEIPELVALAKNLEAESLWIKPMELHGEELRYLLVNEDEMIEYIRYLRLGLYFAKKFKVEIKDSFILKKLINDYVEGLKGYDEKTSFDDQIKEELQKSEKLSEIYFNPLMLIDEMYYKREIPPYKLFIGKDSKTYSNEETSNVESLKALDDLFENIESNLSLTKENLLEIKNAQLPSKYYNQFPCHIGSEYIRIEVSDEVLPCCVSKFPVSKINNQSFNDIWFSHNLTQFRNKMLKINEEKFHTKQKEWLFCQQCPHMIINKRVNLYRSVKLQENNERN